LPIPEHHPDTARPAIAFVITLGEERGLGGSRHMDVSRLSATRGVRVPHGGSERRDHVLGADLRLPHDHGAREKAHAGAEPEKGSTP